EGDRVGESVPQVVDCDWEITIVVYDSRRSVVLDQSTKEELVGSPSASGDSITVSWDDWKGADKLYAEIGKSPEVQAALKRIHSGTYYSSDIEKVRLYSKEHGLFIVRDKVTGLLSVELGGFSNATYKSMSVDSSVIGDGFELVATVHTHPRSSPPTHRSDYPYYDNQAAMKNGWAIVIGAEHSYFVSPSQRSEGYIRYDNGGLLGQ
ncbi:hypothetical protein MLD52_22730, partial [Puniceicoccaceae bacterium K14]|nr:hypothetical protein [Puniceicoccaceae bacterium K14]